jgi:GAF domain-containing protein
MIEQDTAARIIEAVSESGLAGVELRRYTMERLGGIPNYDWAGIYRLEGDALVIDEFVGAPTGHARIPVGRGVCGTAVAENRNQVVADVRALENYLACSVETRSEIVVLIKAFDGRILGQIDVDGHRVGAFDASDETFLDEIARVLADRWLPAASMK